MMHDRRPDVTEDDGRERGTRRHHALRTRGYANITTTSTYLRSTPVRLKRALDKLEAAGFGHYSDKQPETGTSTVPEQGAENPSNSLN